MRNITAENHVKVINASLNKIYNQSRIKGKLESIDLYIFNILFKYINDCDLELTHSQRKQLECIYRIIYNTSKDICKIPLQGLPVQHTSIPVVPEKEGNNVIPVLYKLFYWQEPTPYTTGSEIIDLIADENYLSSKPFFIRAGSEFIINFSLTYIGRVCIAYNPFFEEVDSLIIKDIFGNDITHAFIKDTIPSKNIILYTSNNVHSYGSLDLIVEEFQTIGS